MRALNVKRKYCMYKFKEMVQLPVKIWINLKILSEEAVNSVLTSLCAVKIFISWKCSVNAEEDLSCFLQKASPSWVSYFLSFWPLSRRHYLSVKDRREIMCINCSTANASELIIVTGCYSRSERRMTKTFRGLSKKMTGDQVGTTIQLLGTHITPMLRKTKGDARDRMKKLACDRRDFM